jgi:galactose-1-phosphate uridylyltransferase
MATEPKGPEDYLVFKKPYRDLKPVEPCPFCPGNQRLTRQQIVAIEDQDKGTWAVRVVPSKSSPVTEEHHRPEYHWHLEISLRIGLREGFEWATGSFVNPTPPELAATYLREAG